MNRSVFSAVLLFLSIYCQAQVEKWNNRNRGTYIISWEPMGVNPNPETCIIAVRFYDLSNRDCKPIEGKIRVNGKEYFVYDSTGITNSQGFKDESNFFHLSLTTGDYDLKAVVNNQYYPVKTETIKFSGKTIYTVRFYLIRKNVLKKGN